MESAHTRNLTEDEYLDFERGSEAKHELVNGELVAMAGGTPLHNAVAANVIVALGRLRGRACRPFTSDQSIHIPTTGMYCYPDVSVVCGKAERHPKDSSIIVNPTVVVEVLSKSTRNYDLGEKAAHYRHHPTLAEFLLVDPKAKAVHHYRRIEAREWVVATRVEGDTLALPSLKIDIPVSELFEDTEGLDDEV